MSAEYKFGALMMAAEKLITPNAFNNDGGISAVHEKSKRELENNRLGFNKLAQASKLGVHFHADFNLAEFYYSGLDGATSKDISKSAHHYFKAWKLANNKILKSENASDVFEKLLLNFCGVLEKVNVANKEIFDATEVIKLAKRLHKRSKHPSFKVFGHYIHALITNRLSQRAKAYIQYKKCVELKTNAQISYFAKRVITDAEEMIATMDITHKAMNEQSVNSVSFDPKSYKECRDRFDKERRKLNAENLDKTANLSGLNKRTVETVLVGRTLNEKNENALITSDPSLNMTSVATGKSAERKCAFCKQIGLNMKRCARCKKAHYCKVSCQRSHWKKHKKDCKKL